MNSFVEYSPVLKSHSNNSAALQSYLQDGYFKVHGFLWNEATAATILLNNIQREMKVEGDVGEIGIWLGKYFILLALLTNENEQTIGVDSFIHAENPELQEKSLYEHLKTYVPHNRTHIIKKDSNQLSPNHFKQLAPKGFRIFDVDGDHTAPGALYDLQMISQVMAPGGIMILDDFFNPTCPGVTDAYYQFQASPQGQKFRPFAYIANKLMLTQNEFADTYYSKLFQTIKDTPSLPFRNPMLEFHKIQSDLHIPTQLSSSEIIVILPGSWQ